jgi:futalosine hydrolase
MMRAEEAQAMRLDDVEAMRLAILGSRLVLLTATEAEARPLLAAMTGRTDYLVTTKRLHVGHLHRRAPSPPRERGTHEHTEVGAGTAVQTVLAVSGCDKANTAHMLTCILQALKPQPWLVIQVGVAGAFRSSGRADDALVGDIVLATKEIYSDTGSSSPAGWCSATELKLPLACLAGDPWGGEFALDPNLVSAAAGVIKATPWPDPRPEVVPGPCVTTSQMCGVEVEAGAIVSRWGAVAESMEGAAAAHMCALYGVPFLEVRGVSNLVIDRDRTAWQLDRAIEVATKAALAVGVALDELPLGPRRSGRSEAVGISDRSQA